MAIYVAKIKCLEPVQFGSFKKSLDSFFFSFWLKDNSSPPPPSPLLFPIDYKMQGGNKPKLFKRGYNNSLHIEALLGWSKNGEGKQGGEENGSENVVFPVWFRRENLRERK